MTRAKVVDASAIAALIFAEDNALEIAERMRDGELHAPSLLAYEIANVALKKRRRNLMDDTALGEALVSFEAMDIHFHDVEAASAFRLATRTGLSAYDASYFSLARTLGAELVTLDAKLATVSA